VSDEQKQAPEETKAGVDATPAKERRHKSKRGEGKGQKGGGMVTKVVATVFGAVIAPILVAIGIQWTRELSVKSTPPVTTQPEKKDLLDLVSRDLNDT
jgi:hypothetical protein